MSWSTSAGSRSFSELVLVHEDGKVPVRGGRGEPEHGAEHLHRHLVQGQGAQHGVWLPVEHQPSGLHRQLPGHGAAV